VQKTITDPKRSFHIVGGGGQPSSVNNSVSAGRDFFASCFNTVIKKVNTKQPDKASLAGAVFFCDCEAVQGR
jgi:hypothetical protein